MLAAILSVIVILAMYGFLYAVYCFRRRQYRLGAIMVLAALLMTWQLVLIPKAILAPDTAEMSLTQNWVEEAAYTEEMGYTVEAVHYPFNVRLPEGWKVTQVRWKPYHFVIHAGDYSSFSPAVRVVFVPTIVARQDAKWAGICDEGVILMAEPAEHNNYEGLTRTVVYKKLRFIHTAAGTWFIYPVYDPAEPGESAEQLVVFNSFDPL